jgi:hypothetical protein
MIGNDIVRTLTMGAAASLRLCWPGWPTLRDPVGLSVPRRWRSMGRLHRRR